MRETGEELPGATLELYAPDGTLLESWETSDIPHVITGLPVGEGYVLKETAAPEGYELAEDIVFAVEIHCGNPVCRYGGRASPEEPETPEEPTEPEEPTPTVPQTGGSRMALWVGALLILALGSLGIVLILLKKQNNCNVTEGRGCGPLPFLRIMKREILIVLSVVLVVVIVASGLWLGWYAVDSQHQKQTYKTLAEDFPTGGTCPQPVFGGRGISPAEPRNSRSQRSP